MFLASGADDVHGLLVDGTRKGLALGHFFGALAAAGDVSVDFLPGAHVGEGQVVGRDANDGAVLVVQGLRVEGLDTEGVADAEGDGRGALDERAGVFG